MKTTFEEKENAYVLHFDGRLDTSASTDTERQMQVLYDAFNNESKAIILDCQNLEYISSSGLRLFLGLLKVAKPKGVDITITDLSKDIKLVFDETGFTNLFTFR